MMFVPGNNPGMMADAHIYGPDSIMLDLEDSVTMQEKDAARLLVHNALKSIDYGGVEMVVRINPLNTPYGKKDVEAVVKAGVDVIRMPKTETADEVRELEEEILKVEKEIGCEGRTQIMAAIESALGVVNAYAIATASKRMMGIALGAEDYSANLKARRTTGDSPFFVQIHKRYIVNTRKIATIRDQMCVLAPPMDGCDELLVSKNYRRDLMATFYNM